MKRDKKSQLFWNMPASPSGSPIHYVFGHASWYKGPFVIGLFMGQFLMEKQIGFMSPPSLFPHPHPVFQPQGRHTFFYSLIKVCLAISRSWLVLFPQPFYCTSNSTKNQLNLHFFQVAFLKTLVGNCQHPLLLCPPPSSSSVPTLCVRSYHSLFLMIHIHTHLPMDPKLLRTVTSPYLLTQHIVSSSQQELT